MGLSSAAANGLFGSGHTFVSPPPATASAEGHLIKGGPFPATASAEGHFIKGGPFPATASAEGAQLNVPPFPATASAEGAQLNVPPSLWERVRVRGCVPGTVCTAMGTDAMRGKDLS
jgi:hypothetical protein